MYLYKNLDINNPNKHFETEQITLKEPKINNLNSNSSEGVNIINDPGKRRQYIPASVPAFESSFLPGSFAAPALSPALPSEPLLPEILPPVAPTSTCPSGDSSLPVECDSKRPWPQCPPQSYCYATNTVDIGPYFCCPVCNFLLYKV